MSHTHEQCACKMVVVLNESTMKELHAAVNFFSAYVCVWDKGHFLEMFPFVLRIVCHVQWFIVGYNNLFMDAQKIAYKAQTCHTAHIAIEASVPLVKEILLH